MGCSSTSSSFLIHHNNNNEYHFLLQKKPQLWLLIGGPGSKKVQILNNLLQDYKFKYFSCLDLIQFEQDRHGCQEKQIQLHLSKNIQFSSELIIKLITKAISAHGIRRFIIDGFPRYIKDIQCLQSHLVKFVQFKYLIYVSVSSQTIMTSGLQVKLRNDEDKQEISNNLKTIIQQYQRNTKSISQYYSNHNKIISINGQKEISLVYQELMNIFNQKQINKPQIVKVTLVHFDTPKHQKLFRRLLIRNYGFSFYSVSELIQQAKNKKSKEGKYLLECQQNNKIPEINIIIKLISKKIQKTDYHGNFMISGFGQNRGKIDCQNLQQTLRNQIQIINYINFECSSNKKQQFLILKNKTKFQLSQKQLDQNYKIYNNNLQEIQIYYNSTKKYIKYILLNRQQQQKIIIKKMNQFLLQKNIKLRQQTIHLNLIFISTIQNQNGYIELCKLINSASIINIYNLVSQVIHQQVLQSELLKSYYQENSPLPGLIAVKLLLKKIISQINSNSYLVIVQGFPNSLQQLLVWEQKVGAFYPEPKIILCGKNKNCQSQNRNKLNKKKININIKNAQELQKDIIENKYKYTKLNENNIQQSLKFITQQ